MEEVDDRFGEIRRGLGERGLEKAGRDTFHLLEKQRGGEMERGLVQNQKKVNKFTLISSTTKHTESES